MNIVLLGPPGSGKGTLSHQLKSIYKIPHISTGDIIRSEIKRNTSYGKKIAQFSEKGLLCPDTPEYMDSLYEAIKWRLSESDCRYGFILDGLPRTLHQVEKLSNILNYLNKKIDKVILLDANQDTVISRITGRSFCERCKSTYHVTLKAPKKANICDICDIILTKRLDDTEEIVKSRIALYKKEIDDIVDAYGTFNFTKIDANQDSTTVFKIAVASLFPRNYLVDKIKSYKSSSKVITVYNLIDIYKNPTLVRHIISVFSQKIQELSPDCVAAPEARALPLFGALIHELGLPGVFIRKIGKLPENSPKLTVDYKTAYSNDSLEMADYKDLTGKTVVIIDDGISSGGTTHAVIRLMEKAGARVVGIFAVVQYHYAKLAKDYEPFKEISHTLFDLG